MALDLDTQLGPSILPSQCTCFVVWVFLMSILGVLWGASECSRGDPQEILLWRLELWTCNTKNMPHTVWIHLCSAHPQHTSRTDKQHECHCWLRWHGCVLPSVHHSKRRCTHRKLGWSSYTHLFTNVTYKIDFVSITPTDSYLLTEELQKARGRRAMNHGKSYNCRKA